VCAWVLVAGRGDPPSPAHAERGAELVAGEEFVGRHAGHHRLGELLCQAGAKQRGGEGIV